MLETPKSAKTPSTARIPNSCATSAILENGACTSVTFAPKILSRSRASSSACASRSRLINRPEINLRAIASECPPAPSVASMYVPSGLTRSHSSTSPSITGVCAAANLFGPSQRRLYAATPSKLLDPDVTQSLVVLVRVRIVFQLIQGARMVHHIEIIEGAKYIHFAFRLRRLSQHCWQQHSSLPIHLHRLAVIARPHQEFSLRFIRRWQLCQLVFNLRPNLHRINPRRLACRAGDVKLVPILPQGLQKHGRYLQPALLVHLRRTIPPQLHAPRLTRPRFDWDQARKSGLEGPKCPLSPQSLLLVLSVLPCCALPPATLFYCYPLLTTFAHMIDCICRLSRENMRFFKIFQKSCEKIYCKFPVIFAATACGFGFRLLQPLVVGFSLSFCPVAESSIHSSLLLWYSICDFGSLNVQRSLHHGMGYPSTRRDRPQL